MILDEFFKSKSTAVLAEDNLQGGGPDDEVKFFIDSEPAYYAVMDRFGDHIEFRGDDLVAPQRLWGAIQQTAGDAGGAADIAGLEDDRMGTDDELDEQGVAEGHGNYAGDRPVNLGGVSMKKIQIGDTVRYIDQKAQVVDMSRDREHARITILSSATTKTVLTSDLRPLGRGVQEAGYDSGDYSNDRQSDDYGRDLVPTGSGGSRFVNHGAYDHTRGRPAKTHGFSKNLPADPFGRTAGKIPHSARPKQELDPFRELDELSPATLASYKTKAGAAATAADSAGDRKIGDRRFSGIVKATKKQFDQDAKQLAQAVHESRLRLMASIIKTQ
jgi:hypothetical protein